MDKPIVSVIIPTYNRRSLLMRAVESALSQTLDKIEVIIADDGSTDGTQELFLAGADPRVRYILLPHQGACAARNAGIDLAQGQYIAFLDSDDTWDKEKLEIQRHQLESSGADIVFCAFTRHTLGDETAVRCPDEAEPEDQIHYQRLLGGNMVSTQTLFGKASCFRQIRFDENFPRMQDWEYAIRLAKNFHLRYFPLALADTYLQADSISSKPELGLAAMRLLYAKYRRDFEASLPNTLFILSTIGTFAKACGQGYIRDYWKALSYHRNFRDNCSLFKTALHITLNRLWS